MKKQFVVLVTLLTLVFLGSEVRADILSCSKKTQLEVVGTKDCSIERIIQINCPQAKSYCFGRIGNSWIVSIKVGKHFITVNCDIDIEQEIYDTRQLQIWLVEDGHYNLAAHLTCDLIRLAEEKEFRNRFKISAWDLFLDQLRDKLKQDCRVVV